MSARHHLRHVSDAWRAETSRRRRDRRKWRETEFLPAALEIAESPPSPSGRLILWIIVAVAALALAWSFFSQVDTVAIAQGRLTPTGRLRSVESADPGIVRQILAHEGDHVVEGQPLITLDPTVAQANAASAATDLATAGLVRARANALLASAGGRPARIVGPPGAPPTALQAEQQAVDSRVREYSAKRTSLQERRSAAEATVRGSEATIAKLRQTLPIAEREVKAYQTLADKGYGSQLRLDQERERFIGMSHDLDVEAARRDESRAQVAALTGELVQAQEQFLGQAAKERAEAEGVVATRADEVRKADQRNALQVLRAPVSGVVQEVSVTTLGQVAQTAKPLVTIVPDGEALVVEALLLNQDVGAVRLNDRVIVKLEAYPFTRFGALQGRISHISPDAIVDDKRGLVFPITVRLLPQARGFAPLRLSPGMNASVEVVTGRRRVIDYLWSPVAKQTSEAGRER